MEDRLEVQLWHRYLQFISQRDSSSHHCCEIDRLRTFIRYFSLTCPSEYLDAVIRG
jgi:hypothetical protein